MNIFTTIYFVSTLVVLILESTRFGTNIVINADNTKTKLENLVQYISMILSIITIAIIPVLNTIFAIVSIYSSLNDKSNKH